MPGWVTGGADATVTECCGLAASPFGGDFLTGYLAAGTFSPDGDTR